MEAAVMHMGWPGTVWGHISFYSHVAKTSRSGQTGSGAASVPTPECVPTTGAQLINACAVHSPVNMNLLRRQHCQTANSPTLQNLNTRFLERWLFNAMVVLTSSHKPATEWAICKLNSFLNASDIRPYIKPFVALTQSSEVMEGRYYWSFWCLHFTSGKL